MDDVTKTDARALLNVNKMATISDIVAPSNEYIYASGANELTVVEGCVIAVGGAGIFKTANTIITAANLDAGSAFAVGKDYYVYICDSRIDSADEKYVISLNSTYPTGWNATNSRKIGGFHYGRCRKVDSNLQPLNGSSVIFGTGWESAVSNGIVPRSVWTLGHRPKCSPEGMVYLGGGTWVDIYLNSDDGANTYNNKLGKTDAEYTAAVDNGSYGNFVKDSAGYGLAQWTYWSRKQALLNHAKQAGASIADLNMQLGFLWEELQGYTAVMDALKKAGSVRAASDAVLTGYEKPADQSETVKKKRAEYGEGYYKKYAAGNGTKYYRVRKSWTDAASQLGAFTSLENAKSACKAGYTVYDDNGKAVYTAAGQQTSAGVPFSVQVDILDLNIRTGAGTNYAKTGETTGKGVFTIVEVKAGQGASAGWGRLKSGAGWISLDYATRLA